MASLEAYALAAMFIMAGATVLTRATPFLFLGRYQDNPHLIFIGRLLPPAVMVILVVYCV